MSQTIVIGNGWAALATVGLLSKREDAPSLVWLTGTGSRLLPPLPTLDASFESRSTAVLGKACADLGVESGRALFGSFLREFRNKAFRPAAWTKAPTPAERTEVRNELLWGPEHSLVSVFE